MQIPKVVHRIWLGSEEPAWTRVFAATWERPGWEILQWDQETVEGLFPLVNQDVFDRAEEIAPNHVGQLRSDVLRYELLYRFGGVYVDTDTECLRPLDRLVSQVRCFAGWEVQNRWVGNTILGAEPAHPFIGVLIERLRATVEAYLGCRPNKLTGPQFLTRVHRDVPGLTVFPQARFYPFDWRGIREHRPGMLDAAERWPGAYAVHWWANQRREQGMPVG